MPREQDDVQYAPPTPRLCLLELRQSPPPVLLVGRMAMVGWMARCTTKIPKRMAAMDSILAWGRVGLWRRQHLYDQFAWTE